MYVPVDVSDCKMIIKIHIQVKKENETLVNLTVIKLSHEKSNIQR